MGLDNLGFQELGQRAGNGGVILEFTGMHTPGQHTDRMWLEGGGAIGWTVLYFLFVLELRGLFRALFWLLIDPSSFHSNVCCKQCCSGGYLSYTYVCVCVYITVLCLGSVLRDFAHFHTCKN